MRSSKIFLLLILFVVTNLSSKANPPIYVWEWQFSIKNSSNQFISESITVFYYNSSSKNYEVCGGGSSLTYGNWGSGTWNVVANISGIDPDQPDATFTIPYYNEYVVRIGNQYVRIQNVGYADETFYYSGGSLSTGGNYSVVASGTWTEYSILLKNDFAGGGMYINDEWHSNISQSGVTVTREGSTFPHTLTAVDGQTGTDNYKRLWEKWSNNEYNLYQYLSSPGNYTNYVAQFDKEYNLTFVANSTMYINGNSRTSSWIEYARELSSNTASAANYSQNYIDYTFTNWSSGGQSYSSPITATGHATYTAAYTGKPNNGYRSLSFNYSQEGRPVQVSWSKHPLDNSSITQYAVYRKVTTSGTPTLLTTVNANGSGSYTYTDYDYVISSSENKILLFYDVRAYYSPNSIYTDPSFEGVYGFYNTNKLPSEMAQNQTSLELPTIMSASNYPNPFNPTTTISYQLPEKSFVTLKVFDILGKEVAILVNETKSAGYHSVIFNAGHSERGRGMTSGVYIYTISANGITQSKKMLLAK
jgi:hypothetical protein